jgi:hypothetical protein
MPAASFKIGKHSGTAILTHVLRKNDIYVTAAEASMLLGRVRKAAGVKGDSLSTAELLSLCKHIFPHRPVQGTPISRLPLPIRP